MTRGVGVAPVGGDREGRARADPRGSDGARPQRLPRRGDFASEGGFGNGAVRRCSMRRAPKGSRSHANEDWGHVLCLVGR
jgi:hypothetical protein